MVHIHIPSDGPAWRSVDNANTYADDLVSQQSRPWLEFINDVTDRVDVWLRAGRPADLALVHTASSWHKSTPIYLGELAETVAPFTVTKRRVAAAAYAYTEPNVYAPYTWREGLAPPTRRSPHQTSSA